MVDYEDYGKPCMTNLPLEIGIPIFEQILNSPKPDRKSLDDLCSKLLEQMAREDSNNAQSCIDKDEINGLQV